MTDLPEERIFPLINGGELIQTGERILFSRSIPGMIPLLTDPNVEIDDVLDTLFAAQENIKQLQQRIAEGVDLVTEGMVLVESMGKVIERQNAEIARLTEQRNRTLAEWGKTPDAGEVLISQFEEQKKAPNAGSIGTQ